MDITTSKKSLSGFHPCDLISHPYYQTHIRYCQLDYSPAETRMSSIMKNTIVNTAGKIWSNCDYPQLGNLRFNILWAVYHLFPLIGGINYSRLAEWKYMLNHLPDFPAKILDVGSTTSLFVFKLQALGYKTNCLDQREPNFRLPKSVVFHRDNLMNLGIKPDIYDAVCCISTLEHIGMGRYDDPVCTEGGDLQAVKEMLRVLKPGGRLIVTTNICHETCIYNDEIRYGEDRLRELMGEGRLLNLEYRYFDGRRWLICDSKIAFNRGPEDFAIAMFVLTER